jgi:hypothetical protein
LACPSSTWTSMTGHVLDDGEVHSATTSATDAGVWSPSEQRGRPKPLVPLVACSRIALTTQTVAPGEETPRANRGSLHTALGGRAATPRLVDRSLPVPVGLDLDLLDARTASRALGSVAGVSRAG